MQKTLMIAWLFLVYPGRPPSQVEVPNAYSLMHEGRVVSPAEMDAINDADMWKKSQLNTQPTLRRAPQQEPQPEERPSLPFVELETHAGSSSTEAHRYENLLLSDASEVPRRATDYSNPGRRYENISVHVTEDVVLPGALSPSERLSRLLSFPSLCYVRSFIL